MLWQQQDYTPSYIQDSGIFIVVDIVKEIKAFNEVSGRTHPNARKIKLGVTGLTSNGKRQKWNFCRLSLALWTVEWKYLYLWRKVGDIFLFYVI